MMLHVLSAEKEAIGVARDWKKFHIVIFAITKRGRNIAENVRDVGSRSVQNLRVHSTVLKTIQICHLARYCDIH